MPHCEVSSEEWEFETVLSVIEREVEAKRGQWIQVSGRNPVMNFLLQLHFYQMVYLAAVPAVTALTQITHHYSVLKWLKLKRERPFWWRQRGVLSASREITRPGSVARRWHALTAKRDITPVSVVLLQRATTTSPGTRQASPVSSQSTSMHQPPKTSTSQNSQSSVLSMFIDVRTPVLLQTARAVVYKPGAPAVAQTTRIVFDTGSQWSYKCGTRLNYWQSTLKRL